MSRILGRSLLVLIMAVACSPAPTEPATGTSTTGPSGCVDLSGTYDVTYSGSSCPANSYPATWVLDQSGCTFQARVTPDLPTVKGSVEGSVVKLEMRNGFIACTYQLDGSGQFVGRTLRATVAGNVSGPCCSGTESMQIVAVRR